MHFLIRIVNIFLDEALDNKSLYWNAELREELNRCCFDYEDSDHDLFYPNIYNLRKEAFARACPEWFEDWEKPALDEVKNPLSLLKLQLDKLGIELNMVIKRIDDFQEKTISLKNNIFNRLDLIWILVAFAVGYFISK